MEKTKHKTLNTKIGQHLMYNFLQKQVFNSNQSTLIALLPGLRQQWRAAARVAAISYPGEVTNTSGPKVTIN